MTHSGEKAAPQLLLCYADELFKIARTPEMINSGIFPNMKEWTEAAACYHAVRKHIGNVPGFSLRDRGVRLLAVGDGTTPRVGGMFALRSSWECVSVDPAMKRLAGRVSIDRLTLHSERIQDVFFDEPDRPTVIVACHSHVALNIARARVASRRTAIVAMPCCVEQSLDTPPDIEYDDWACWSPERRIKIWKPPFDGPAAPLS